MSHIVAVRLPDGRHATAGYADPIVKTMRKINKRLAVSEEGAPEDYAVIAAWLDRIAPLDGPQGVLDFGDAA